MCTCSFLLMSDWVRLLQSLVQITCSFSLIRLHSPHQEYFLVINTFVYNCKLENCVFFLYYCSLQYYDFWDAASCLQEIHIFSLSPARCGYLQLNLPRAFQKPHAKLDYQHFTRHLNHQFNTLGKTIEYRTAPKNRQFILVLWFLHT